MLGVCVGQSHTITAYGSTPYVGDGPEKKMAATLKVHK